ncbi:MAG: hypothetical protein LLG16_06685 [Euryarchaeota archaeon]|nr:hypothetical protein [Euryarchaeota archaeon]
MNKKMILGAFVGALALIAVIATAVTAAPSFASSGSADELASNGMNGDCDRTQDQLTDRDHLRDGPCGNCTNIDGTSGGAMVMNQNIGQDQARQGSAYRAMECSGPDGDAGQQMHRNGMP